MVTCRTEAAHPRPGEHDAACNRMPNGRGHQRRNGLDCVANGEVRRTPDEVDRYEGECQLDGVCPVVRCRLCDGWRYVHGSATYVYHPAAAEKGRDLRCLFSCHH